MELFSFSTEPDGLTAPKKADAVEMLITSLQIFFGRISDEYNKTTADEPLFVTAKRLRTSDVDTVASATQKDDGVSAANVAPGGLNHATPDRSKAILDRLLVSSSIWALSVRAREALAEFFMIPATELHTLHESELPSRLKLTLELGLDVPRTWMMNGTPVSTDELNALMRGLFKDLVTRSKNDYEKLPDAARLVSSGQSFAGSIRSLVADKHTLLQKIVDQQEAIQGQIARELHDAVLGNLMLLRRSLSDANRKRMSDEDMVAILDEVSSRLREISQELSPRDLVDCGLRVMLEELCRNLERGGCEYKFECPVQLPPFTNEVTLHLYRIAQECINNVLKHSLATQAVVQVSLDRDIFRMRISDNGQGFDAAAKPKSRTTYGGAGTGIIRERTELINCAFPARSWVDSQPGGGTAITIEVTYKHPADI